MSFLLKGKKIFLFVFLLFILFSPAQDVFSQGSTGVSTPITGGQESASFASATEGYSADGEKEEVNWKEMILNTIGGLLDGLFKALIPVFEVIALAALTIASFLLGIASYIFDIFVQIGVYGISDIVGQGEDSPVKKAWLIFRNIANIGLIFVVISIAIGTILQSSGYEGKKLLGRVIVAALLMNFSFFLGAIVVDVSNEMALTVYKEIKKETEAKENQSANLGTFIYENSGVAVIIAAGRDTVSKNEEKTFEKTVENSKWKVIGQYAKDYANTLQDPKSDEADKMVFNVTSLVAGAVAALVLAVVLLIAGFAIMGRLIAILLLLVVSPIAFMSMILPKTQKISDDWWKSIIGHSFYLPAFLLFIYVGLKILKSFQDMDMSKYIEGINNNSDSVASYIGTIKVMTIAGFAMGITIGLFIAALIVAKKISDGGSAAVGKISAAVTSGVGGAAMAGGAFLGRNTVGAGASWAAKNDSVKKFAQSLNPIIGGNMMRGLSGIAKSSFDTRNAQAFKGVASATGVGSDLKFDKTLKPQKDGFKGQSDRLSQSIQGMYNAIPDLDAPNEKAALDSAKANLDSSTAAMASLKKKVAAGTITAGHSSYTAAETALASAQAAHTLADTSYSKAKNPAKHSFLHSPPPLPGTRGAVVNNVVNFWAGDARADARTKIPMQKTKAEKQNEAILKALSSINKQP
jgi:hypothetical protein